MPGKKECNKIKDPVSRRQCLAYAGRFAPARKNIKSKKRSSGY